MGKFQFPEFGNTDPDKGFEVFMKYVSKTFVQSLAIIGLIAFLFVKCGS